MADLDLTVNLRSWKAKFNDNGSNDTAHVSVPANAMRMMLEDMEQAATELEFLRSELDDAQRKGNG